MSFNVMLDIAIGLVMMYLIGALFCTILQEWIASALDWRAKNLRDALGYLISGQRGTIDDAAKDILAHPLLRVLESGTTALATNAPSYVSARNFSLAIVDRYKLIGADGKIDTTDLQATVGQMPEPLAKVLAPIITAAGGDANKALTAMDTWFDSMMDRASGWYKRRAQLLSFGVGAAIAILAGMDTIGVANRLARDPALRERVADMARVLAPADSASTVDSTKQLVEDSLRQALGLDIASGDSANKHRPPEPPTIKLNEKLEEKAKREAAEARRKAWDSARDKLADQVRGSSDSPFGPSDWNRAQEKGPGAVLLMLIGCIISAAAIALGAPFWYGALQQLNAIRGSGPKPARAQFDLAKMPT